jgi:hypothetical protein
MTLKLTRPSFQNFSTTSHWLSAQCTRARRFLPTCQHVQSTHILCPKTTIHRVLSIDFNTPSEVVDSLQRNNFISLKEVSNLKCALDTTGLPYEKTIVAKALYAQATAIKNALSSTHFTFLHAQASCGMVLNCLIKELMKTKICPSLLQDYEFLRCPNFIHPDAHNSIDMYRNSETTHDTDAFTEDDLLSVDAYFYNTQVEESALYYLACNSNAGNFSKKIHKAAQQALEQFYPDVPKDKIEEESRKLMEEMSMIHAPCGNLYTLSIPKEEMQRIVYRAHPFGKACNCHERERDEHILTNLQNGKICRKTKCQRPFTIPQYRMSTQELLKFGKNRRIYCLSPLSSNAKMRIKTVVEDIMRNLRQSPVIVV